VEDSGKNQQNQDEADASKNHQMDRGKLAHSLITAL
jgi:hypothetical protein